MKRMFALLGSITLGIALTLGLFWGLPAISAEEPSVEDEVWAQATKQQVAVDAALSWLRTQQADDGSFSGSEGITIDVVLALAAANEDPNTWTENGNSPLDYLETRVITYANLNPASAGKLALGVIAADKDPYNFGGTNIISKVTSYYNPATGQYSNTTSSTTWDQALAMLALSASFETVAPTATARLKSLQQADGGWEFSALWGSDTNSTALAMEALIAAGEPATSTALVSATTYLSNTQIVTDAGFPYQNPNPWGPTESDAPSTAMAIQGLIAREEDPLGATWTKGISTPFGTLLSFQSPAGGFKGFSGPNDLQSTAQSVPAVMGKPLPIRGRVMAARKALEWTRTYQNDDGGFRGWGADSDASATADMVLAIAAYGDDPNTWLKSGKSPMDYLATQAASYATYAGATGKLIVTVVAGKGTPEFFGGMNLYTKLQSFYDSNTGAYGSSVDDQAWAILALKAMGKPVPPVVVNRLKSMVNPNGSWTWWGDASYGTGMALMALKAVGEDPDSSFYFDEAYAYWRNTMQMNDGGFPQDNPNPWPPTESDTNSTSFVILGIMAGGQNPDSWKWSKQLAAGEGITIPVNTPLDWLIGMQNASKAFGWTKSSTDDNFYSTRQAIPALMLETFLLNEPTLISITTKPITGYQISCNDVLVIAPFEEDADEDATASLQWTVDGGALQDPQAMTRNSNSFSTTVAVTGTNYVFTATYSDLDGVSGTNPQTQTISLNINQTWAYTITAQQVCTSTVVTATFCGDANANLGGTATHTSRTTPVISGTTAMVRDSGILTANIPITRSDTYTVEVLYQDTDGVAGDAQQSMTMTVELPMADFTISPSLVFSGTVTQLTDASEGGPTAWQWNFGDGSPIAITQNPTHTYHMTGTFTVHQTVTFGICDTLVATKLITVAEKSRVYLPVILKGYNPTSTP